jgi:hypothetical protein
MRDPWGTAQTLAALGRLAIADGQLDEARRVLTESLRLRRDVDDMVGVVDSLEASPAWSLHQAMQKRPRGGTTPPRLNGTASARRCRRWVASCVTHGAAERRQLATPYQCRTRATWPWLTPRLQRLTRVRVEPLAR